MPSWLTYDRPSRILDKELPAVLKLLADVLHVCVLTSFLHTQCQRPRNTYGLEIARIDGQAKNLVLVHFEELLGWINAQYKGHVCNLHRKSCKNVRG